MLLSLILACDGGPPASSPAPKDCLGTVPAVAAEAVTSYDQGSPAAASVWEGRDILVEHGMDQDGSGVHRGQVAIYDVTASAELLYTIEGERDYQGFGGSAATGGDLDADGLPDLAVGALDYTLPPYEHASVYLFGSPTLESPGAASVVEGTGVDFFGAFFDFVGPAVVVGMPEGRSGGLSVIRHSSEAWRHRDDLECVLAGPEFGFGNGVQDVGDVDGDGTPDLLVGGDGTSFYVDGLDLLDACAIAPVELEFDDLGTRNSVPDAGVGDTNGDGRSDFVAVVNDCCEGRAYVFTDGSGVATGQVVYVAEVQDTYGVAAAGDLDGDELTEFYLNFVAWELGPAEGEDLYSKLLVVGGPVCGSVDLTDVAAEVVGYPEGGVDVRENLVSNGATVAFGLDVLGDETGAQTVVFRVQ